MPAFSRAIFAKVSPKTSTWSNPRLVTPHAAGERTRFVASNLPPRPTSRTRHSTLAREKMRKPRRVRKRKYAGTPRSAHFSRTPRKSHQNSRTNVVLGDGDAADAETLADVDEVRGGVETRAGAALAEDVLYERAG